MMSLRGVMLILPLLFSFGILMPGKHFLIETDSDEAEDASSDAVEHGGIILDDIYINIIISVGRIDVRDSIWCE